MKNDDFKNNMQKQLDGLRFKPSEKVWPQVKEQLQKDKRRSRIIFFCFFIAGLIISGGLVTFINSSSQKKIADAGKIAKPEIKIENKLLPDATNEKQLDKSADFNSVDRIRKKTAVQLKEQDNAIVSSVQKIIKTQSKIKMMVNAPMLPSADDDKNINKLKNKSDGKNEIRNFNDIAKNNAPPQTIVVKIPSIDTVRELTLSQKKVLAIAPPDDSTKNKKPAIANKKKIKSPWIFSAVAAFGESNIGNGFTLNINDNKSFAYDAGAITNPAPNNSLPNVQPVFKKGFAFSIGFEAEKKIKKYFSFVTGLEYHYLSSSFLTGQSNDSLNALAQGRYYYSQGSSKNYTNNFHFIAIPVGIKATLFDKKSLSADINAGVNIMQLLSTNALLYDTAARLYYADKNIFNKTQLALIAGLQLNYKFKKGFTIGAGPQFMHTITALGNEYNYSKKYFKVWAIKAKINLNKRRGSVQR